MSAPARVAVIGDVHLFWDDRDVAWFDAAGYELLLFVGDLAGYRRGANGVARSIAKLSTPALVIPGNHDATTLPHLAAETFEHPRLARLLGFGHGRRAAALARALAPVPLVGYSRHELELGGARVSLVACRPHSQGGRFLAFASYLERRFGVGSLERSAALLCELVEACQSPDLVFFAHNGPTGLGAKKTDIWGCDFKREAGDWGDADLRLAIEHAKRLGKRVLAVVAGHMHHRTKGGGERVWRLEHDGVLYVNAARVPRIARRDGKETRYHVKLEIGAGRASAERVAVAFSEELSTR